MAARTETLIDVDMSVKELKKVLPDIQELLTKIGYSPVTKMMVSMSKSDAIPLSNIARAAGLTEIEIGLLVEELNERLTWSSPGTARKAEARPKAKAKAGAKAKTKTKAKAKKMAKGKAKAKKASKGKARAKKKGKAEAKKPKRRAS